MFLGCLNVNILGKTLFNQFSTSLVDFQGTIYRCNILFGNCSSSGGSGLTVLLIFLLLISSWSKSGRFDFVFSSVDWEAVHSEGFVMAQFFGREMCWRNCLSLCNNAVKYVLQKLYSVLPGTISIDWNQVRWNENGWAR